MSMLYFTLNDELHYVKKDDFENGASYVLFFTLNHKRIGMINKSFIEDKLIEIPLCFVEQYKDVIKGITRKAFDSLNIKIVLKLIVNNENYIHYLIQAMDINQIKNREGTYIVLEADKENEGKFKIYVGRSGYELASCLELGITADKHGDIALIHDEYLYKALSLLKDLTKQKNICFAPIIEGIHKDPASNTLKPWDDKPELLCPICKETGWASHHRSDWWNDGTIYKDTTYRTGYKHYGRLNHSI